MSDFLDMFEDGEAPKASLEYVRVGGAPAFVVGFTTETEEVRVHYVPDRDVKNYVICPGTGRCPLCHVGDAAKVFVLLPVYDFDSGAVAVLHVSKAIGPGALGPALRRALGDGDAADKLLLISRRESRYTVEVRPLPDNADRGEQKIKAFLAAREAGLKLSSAFQTVAAEDLAALEGVKRKLDAIGGFRIKSEKDGQDAPGAAPSSAS